MAHPKPIRSWTIAVVIALGVFWALTSAETEARRADSYPNDILASVQWLETHHNDPGLIVVDVREDKYFNGRVIPGAVRMPWRQFQEDHISQGLPAMFVGPDAAQTLLGRHGVARTDTVVLYDSVQRDGGATASYIFWVLEVLGHQNVKVLERGLDAWIDAGLEVDETPRAPVEVLYQAPMEELRLDRWVTGDFLKSRLGDPHYQILDVRSRGEYLGEKLNTGIGREPLKAGHVPTAFNVDYTQAWADPETKAFKTSPELQDLYAGLDPNKTVVTYCHSGRRASFGYFTLRLMGFPNAAMYDGSWNEWGSPRFFFPVELQENPLQGEQPGTALRTGAARTESVSTNQNQQQSRSSKAPDSGGYISCGG